jgi:hypothetical protein
MTIVSRYQIKKAIPHQRTTPLWNDFVIAAYSASHHEKCNVTDPFGIFVLFSIQVFRDPLRIFWQNHDGEINKTDLSLVFSQWQNMATLHTSCSNDNKKAPWKIFQDALAFIGLYCITVFLFCQVSFFFQQAAIVTHL